jgi:chromosome segregation ATPase
MDAVTQIVLTAITVLFGAGGVVSAIITARKEIHIEELKGEADERLAKVEEQRADVDMLRGTLETLRDDAKKQRAQYIAENERLLARVKQLEDDSQEHQRTIAQLRAQISRYEAEIARLTAKLAAYEQGQRA